MIDDVIHSFLEYDAATKNEAWAADKCRIIIANALQVISQLDYEAGENVLFGKFPEVDIKRIFGSKAMQTYKTKLSENTSLHIFEAARMALIDDRNVDNLKCYVNSLDPEKEEKKNKDRELLKNRKGLEGLMNDITASNGMPPQQIKGADFHGNIDDFDRGGGDDMDPDSIDTFFEAHWGLQQEIMLQKPVNAIARTVQISRNFDKYINDILICLHTWSRCLVDERNGSIRNEHLYPYQVYVLNATGSNDYKDAQGFRIPISTNVRGFLKEFGSSFDIQRDWQLLLGASNGGTVQTNTGANLNNNVSNYSGITENGQLFCGTRDGNTIDFKAVLDMRIQIEYCEWKSITRKRSQWVVTPYGNIVPNEISENSPPVDGVNVEIKEYEETYRAWYFANGMTTPRVIKWGKLYMQNIEGVNDEYSGFSIKGNKRQGVPMVDVLRPFWNIMNVAFKMFEMLVNDVKPDGYFFNHTSLMKMVAVLQAAKDKPDDAFTAIENFLKMVQESPNALSDNPTTDEGDPLGGGNMAILPKKNGLNDAAPELMKVMDWVELKVQKYTSTEGVVPTGGSDGYKLSLENKKRTRQATSYIDFILLNHLEDITITNINFVMDISRFKDIPAYKYLSAQVGEKCMDFIASMKKAPHRYGTYIDSFNNDIELLEMKQLAMQEYQKGTLPFEDMLVVRSSESIKDALAYLAGARRKAEKKRQQEQLGILKQQDANDAAQHKRKMELENLKGEWMEKARGKEALGFSNASAVNAKARIAAEQLKQEGQNQRVADEANNDIDEMTKKFNLQQQQAAPI